MSIEEFNEYFAQTVARDAGVPVDLFGRDIGVDIKEGIHSLIFPGIMETALEGEFNDITRKLTFTIQADARGMCLPDYKPELEVYVLWYYHHSEAYSKARLIVSGTTI